MENKDQPNYQCADYIRLCPDWCIIDDIGGGETKLKAKTKTYLPKFPIEGDESYTDRLRMATLFPAFNETVEGMAGLVFRKNPSLSEKTPPAIVEQWENIDNAGTHGDVFCRDAFEDLLEYGYGFILVDFPPASPDVTTLAAERAAKRRPYWVHYEPSQVPNWRHTVIDGERKLSQITFRECTIEPSGRFEDKEVVRYRVWFLEGVAKWELWREETKADGKTKEYVLEDGDSTNLPEIPVAVIGEVGDDVPMLDLARLNILHRQRYSNYNKGLDYAGLAVPWIRNASKEQNGSVGVGWDVLFQVEDNGEFGFAETSGKALESHVTALDNLKQDMATIGLSFLVEQNQTQKTATESSSETTQETSKLAKMARTMSDAIERAFQFHAMYLGLDPKEAGSIDLTAGLNQITLNAQMIMTYNQVVKDGNLSRDTFWQLLTRAGMLPDDFDPALEQNQLRAVDIIPLSAQ